MSMMAEMNLVIEMFRVVNISEDGSFGWWNWDPLFGEAEIFCLADMIIKLAYISVNQHVDSMAKIDWSSKHLMNFYFVKDPLQIFHDKWNFFYLDML